MARPAPVNTDDSAIPAAMTRFFRNRASELLGLGLLALTGLIVVALATWSPSDPSLSYAIDKEPANLLGMPGAVTADLLMQATGLGVIAFIAPLIAWACRWLGHGAVSAPLSRIAAWFGGTALFAGALSCLPAPSGWALPSGLGGVTGDLGIMPLIAPLNLLAGSTIAHTVTFLAYSAFAIWALFYACALSSDELSAMGRIFGARGRNFVNRTSRFLSRIVHFGKARLTHYQSGQALENEPKRPSFIRRNKFWSADENDAPIDPVNPVDPDIRQEPVFTEASLPPLPTLTRVAPAASQIAPKVDLEEFAGNEEPAELPEHANRVSATAPPPAQGMRIKQETRRPVSKKAKTFQLPPLTLLSEPSRINRSAELSADALEANARLLEGVLDDFGIRGEIINVRPGPVVTLYELEPAPGIKSSRIIGLADDIARSMSAISARVAVVPGRNAIGIELPNAKRETVYLRELLASEPFEKSKHSLNIALGKNIGGEPIFADLARMPHLLIAGTTGSGKSVGINTMILSLLYRLSPDQCKLIMIDPKMLELSVYEGIPHLLAPVVTDPKKAVVSLKWAVREMEDRYRKMSKLGVRNVDGFNQRVAQAAKKGEILTRTVQTGFNPETGEPIYEQEEMTLEPLPYIVVIIDEMADLMMVAGKDIEGAVQRLAQMARAAGIHVVMATQRPSVDVITGTIKANFPTRISFQVTSKIDSRTILGEMGAEQLLGMGDMLYMAGGGRISRLHGAFVADEEVEEIVKHLKAQGAPQYVEAVTEDVDSGDGDIPGMLPEGTGDELYDKAVAIVIRDKKASTSYIQRRLQIGYNRAATLIEKMEQEGVIGAANHAGKRDILVGGADETIPDQDF
jgi:S-DNA-T family DNA segregation ATPase FtsK/SpoIIIE